LSLGSGNPVSHVTVTVLGMCPAPLIELALHVEEPGFIRLIIQAHGWFLRLPSSIGSLPTFAMHTAFPCSDHYAGSAPSIHHLQSPWLAGLRCRAAHQGSHGPVLDLHLVGGILYPWRFRATTCEEIVVAEPVIQTGQWRTSSLTNSDRINSRFL